MRKILVVTIFLVSIHIFCSCEKENIGPITEKVLYLSSVKLNGLLSSTYFYDDNKLVQRINNYDTLGVFTSYYTYEYTSSNKLFKVHNFDNTGKSIGLYVYEYNSKGVIKSSFYATDTSTIPINFTEYNYDQLKQCVSSTTHDGNFDLILYFVSNEYANWNRVKSTIFDFYDINSIKATLYYTFDDKVNPNKYLSTVPLKYSLHNTIAFSSPDAIANGGIIDKYGKVWMDFTNTKMSFLFSTSVYQYNNYGYPIKQTRTYTYKPSKQEVFEYEYIQ